MTDNNLHIGKLIQEKLKENGQTVAWFAKKISCHRTNAYKIFDKPHLNSSQLSKISSILNYNFFSHYPEHNENNKKV